MIPTGQISRYQQGQFADASAPKINLGASLARIFGTVALTSRASAAIPVRTSQDRRKMIRKVITARRISDVFLNLPKISENLSKTAGELVCLHFYSKESLFPKV